MVPAQAVGELPAGGTPLIACGPPGLLRTAFLAGCDDYLRDPWAPEELGLRALALLARTRRRYQFPWGAVSFEGTNLRAAGGLITLTLHESRILEALLRARGRPVPRAALTYAVGRARGEAPGSGRSRAIDVHVAAIRRKVRGAVPAAGRFIVCARGQGYLVP